MRKLVWIIVVIIVIAAGVWFFTKNKKGEAEEAPSIIEQTVELSNISKIVESTGIVASNIDVEIKCKASGEIINLPYDISDTVVEGDLLLELDPEDEIRNVQSSQVSVNQSVANLEKARQNLAIAEENLRTSRSRAELDLANVRARADEARAQANRVKGLYENGFASEEELQAAETAAVTAETAVDQAVLALEVLDTEETALELRRQDVILAQASLQTSNLNLENAKQRLDETKVYSPIEGVVTDRPVQIGQIISSGISSTSGGTTVMILSDLSRIYILASVDESDIGKVEVGKVVEITADAFADEKFTGVVERIAQKGTNVQSVVTFDVKIEVKSENKNLLKPEMTANVEIIIDKKENAIVIPVNALVRGPEGTMVNVKMADGTVESRAVETGINDGMSVEIVSGLSEGETIVIDQGSLFSRWTQEESGAPRRFGMGGPPGVGGGRGH